METIVSSEGSKILDELLSSISEYTQPRHCGLIAHHSWLFESDVIKKGCFGCPEVRQRAEEHYALFHRGQLTWLDEQRPLIFMPEYFLTTASS